MTHYDDPFLLSLCILLQTGKKNEGVRHNGEDCWYACTNMNMANEGRCGYCGTGGMCCKKGSRKNGCDGSFGGNSRHECVPFTGAGNFLCVYKHRFPQAILYLFVFCIISTNDIYYVLDHLTGSPDETDGMKNVGQRCHGRCGSRSGPCSWCGSEGMCCKLGLYENGCHSVGVGGGHQCTMKPVPGKFTRLVVTVLLYA